MRGYKVGSNTLTITAPNIRPQDIDIDIDYDIEIVLTTAKEEEKIAAVLYCFSNNADGGFTVRTARICAVKHTPVGEKTVYKIIRALSYRYGYIYFNTKKRRWLPTDKCPSFDSFSSAIEFVSKNHISF